MSTNPILKSTKNILFYLLFIVIIANLYLNLISYYSKTNVTIIIVDAIVFNLLIAILGFSFWYSSVYLSIENNKISKIILTHLGGGILISVVWMVLGYLIVISLVADTELFDTFFVSTIRSRFVIGILYYFLMTAFYYIVIYYSGFQERVVKETELKNLVTEAELRSLKFQINPHFIFNSLNSISALTEIDPKRARQMIIKLADFLRFTLANNDRQKTTLTEELKNIRLYLDIEKIRFEDKFEYIEELYEECGKAEIPSMILQPLFENAIKHAVYETLTTVKIILTCKKQDDFLKITLCNNFEGESHKKGAGVGLKNIEDRLKLIYHQDNLMEVKKENNKFTVSIFIPVKSFD
ncbi:MAG: histidine kinase [Ignavibacteriota bacterium]|nr:GHKL domain-containing protein [Ignavibacteriota bacterium]MBW7842450.1 histidine kinase [Ignavibacterium sp.]MCO6447214.1 histidine kinase [Ignavibacterium album]MCZ2270178.1 histidine kinase [Ignavibacteriales bacterium]HMN18773.1 histidine kinase [Ignavibacteriaceae bacterium]